MGWGRNVAMPGDGMPGDYADGEVYRIRTHGAEVAHDAQIMARQAKTIAEHEATIEGLSQRITELERENAKQRRWLGRA